MAEHLRNEMARAGIPVRPSRIQTLAKFLEDRVPAKPASKAALHLAMEHALEKARPTGFEGVLEFQGFRKALADLFEEVPGIQHPDLTPVFREARARLDTLGLLPRQDLLRAAALQSAPGASHIVLDGFFSLTEEETLLVEALSKSTSITLVLPEAPGRLLRAGFTEQRFEGCFRTPIRNSFQAATLEQEVEEIARLILLLNDQGVDWREIGIVLRSRVPYGAAIGTTLARFGIPLRTYFTDPVSAHPVIQYLAGIVRAALGGWNYTDLAKLLRMPVSGFGATTEGDKYDFKLREQFPGAGIPPRGIEVSPEIVNKLAEWNGALLPGAEPEEWATQLKQLRALLPALAFADRVSREQVRAWTSTAEVLAQWEQSMDETALACRGLGRIQLKEFWQKADTVLSIAQVRVRDRRRNAVALLDVFEARQWQLRVAFVPGMMERLFPHYHREDPILGDVARDRLGLSTAAKRQQEERFLFNVATSRATDQIVLSYPRFNEKGDEVLPSFFWDHEPAPLPTQRVRPAPENEVRMAARAPIQDPQQLARLKEQHSVISPTSIEDFLQCPFLFLGRRTLALKDKPLKPRERLDALTQGSILHDALADWAGMPLLGLSALLGRFEKAVAKKRVPEGYRTEAVRLELLRHFEAFLRDQQVTLAGSVKPEKTFLFELAPGITLKGRIDRIDVGPGKQALIIDYKYSAGERIKDNVEKAEDGDKVQAGLYWLAVEKDLGLEPIGMLYCGLRKKVVWNGWHLDRPSLRGIGEARTRDAMRELIQMAESRYAGST